MRPILSNPRDPELLKLNQRLRPLAAVVIVMILSLLAMLGVLSLPNLFPWMMERMGESGALEGASVTRRMLECCRIWYMVLMGAGVIIWAALGLCAVFTVRGLFLCMRGALEARRERKANEKQWLQESLATLHEFLEEDEVEEIAQHLEPKIAPEQDPWEAPDGTEGAPEPTPGLASEVYENALKRSGGYAMAALLLLCGVPVIILMALFPGMMLTSEDVPALYAQVTEDIARLDAGETEQFTVWLSPKAREVTLPGPWSESYPTPLTRYGAISGETGGAWVMVYVPQELGFALDPDALYNENRSVAWNEAHAVQYQVSYTRNFCFVTGIRPLGLPYALG